MPGSNGTHTHSLPSSSGYAAPTEWSVEPVGSLPEVDAAEYLGARLATTVRPGLRERLAATSGDAAGDAYLVSRARQDEFGAAVAALEAEGYELRVTGPWPPYSFARLP
ncbi:MAG TPA: GvpL/GvpF family gas vesicle protein [Gaiellaceae bacterium]